jgi:hypothetical protein
MEKTDILIFDVEMGQCIFVYPHSNPEYGTLIDCGNTPEFDPIDFLISKGYVNNNILSNLTLTNYDQDHFSGIQNLKNKVSITTVSFAPNLTSSEIKELKEKPCTEALNQVCDVKDAYIYPAPNHVPPFTKQLFYLEKNHLDVYDTNNLSQIIFIEHNGSVICISGDLEEKGWNALLEKQPGIKDWLVKTNIFIASHHGRDNGYCPGIFLHCKPECVVISDKGIVHDTQKDMASVYGKHVNGNGINLNNQAGNQRKVITTRDDGHIYIQLFPGGTRVYSNFTHK